MRTKIKNWWNTPWTNGTYIKCCFGGMVISAMIYFIAWVAYKTKQRNKKTDRSNVDSRFDEVSQKDFRM